MIRIKWDPDKLAEAKKNHWEWVKNRLENKSFKSGESYKDFVKSTLNIASDKDLETLITGSYGDVMKLNIGYRFCSKPKKKRKGETDEEFKVRNQPHVDETSKRDRIIDALGYHAIDNEENWNFYRFCKLLNVDVCPYCNRQYIFSVNKKIKKVLRTKTKDEVRYVSRPEIDHFIPKSIYPQYSCSLFNFVPSCMICNHVKSKREVFEIDSNNQADVNKLCILYPYNDGFGDDGVFAIKYDKDFLSEKAKLIDPSNSCVFVDVKKGITPTLAVKEKQIQGSLSMFFIEDFYNKHKNDLEDLLTRYENYSRPVTKDIVSLFFGAETNSLFPDGINEDEKAILVENLVECKSNVLRNEILGLPLGSENREYPLKKFKTDILKQLDDMYNIQKNEK